MRITFRTPTPGGPDRLLGEATLYLTSGVYIRGTRIWADPDGSPYVVLPSHYSGGSYRDDLRFPTLADALTLKRAILRAWYERGVR